MVSPLPCARRASCCPLRCVRGSTPWRPLSGPRRVRRRPVPPCETCCGAGSDFERNEEPVLSPRARLSQASDRVYRCQSVSKLQSSRLALVQRSLTGACTKSRALRAVSNRATALLAEGCIERHGRESWKRHSNLRRESNRRTPPLRAHAQQRRESTRETPALTVAYAGLRRHHSDNKTIAVVPKASCVGSTAI